MTSERLSTGETGFDIVPPLKLIAFIGLPTEQHDAPLAHRRKIDQTLPIIFKLNAEAFEFFSMR